MTEAHAKLKEICAQDFSLEIALTPVENTLYIYVPVAVDLFRTTAAQTERAAGITASTPKRQINFSEASWEAPALTVRFDITTVNAYPKPQAYTSAYTDEFSRIHNGMLSAITRSYGDLDDEAPRPEIVVLMIIDTRNGVGLKNIFSLKDLQQLMTGLLAQDEYVKRYMTDITGGQNLINNTTGRGIDMPAISWPEFIARQIAYRITFKYTRSQFPPVDSDVTEILTIVHETTLAYEFEDFSEVMLNNLASGETLRFNKQQLRLGVSPRKQTVIPWQAPPPSDWQ